ncbi:MAG: hypothetical protein GYB32_09230 [Algicola sp.]|nr:hypothetical protein [Algicola sp.]
MTENTTLETYRIENLPSIGVVTGNFDNIESILYSIGLVDVDTGAPLFDIIDGMSYDRLASEPVHGHHSNHQHSNVERTNPLLEPNVDFTYQQLLADPALLSSYDIIFINCGVITGDYDGGQNLYDFVNNGGYLYATDWASKALETITNNGSDFVTFYTPERSGSSLSTTANILNDDLIAWLQYFGITDTDTVEIDEFLGSWQVIDTYDSATTYSWLDGPVVYYNDLGDPVEEIKDLALTFPLGNGGVLYSSFHTENTDPDFTITDRIMEYMVFEMSAVE